MDFFQDDNGNNTLDPFAYPAILDCVRRHETEHAAQIMEGGGCPSNVDPSSQENKEAAYGVEFDCLDEVDCQGYDSWESDINDWKQGGCGWFEDEFGVPHPDC